MAEVHVIPLAEGPGRTRLNGSYRTALIPVARFFNLFTRRSVADKSTLLHIPYWYPARKRILRRLNRSPLFGRVPSPEHLLGRSTVDWIRQRFAEGNRALQERRGVNLAELDYATEAPPFRVGRPGRSPLLQRTKN